MCLTMRLRIVGLLLLSLLTAPASAITVGLNSTVVLPGTTFAQRPELNGTSLAPNSTTTLNQTSPDDLEYAAVRLNFDVLREPGGGLLFTYRPENLSTFPTNIRWNLVIPDLPYQEIDADVLLDSPGIHSTITVSRNAVGDTTFTSDTLLASGQSSQTLFISIPWATDYVQNTALTLNTLFDPTLPEGQAPVDGASGTGYAPIPEPTSALLVLLATAGLALRLRCR